MSRYFVEFVHEVLEAAWLAGLECLHRQLVIFDAPGKAKIPSALLLGEDAMGLKYGITLPAPTAPDFASFELEETKNGSVGVDAVDGTSTFVYAQGDDISWRVREVDDAGLKGEWSDPYAFMASDTIPPGKAGSVTAMLLEEVPD